MRLLLKAALRNRKHLSLLLMSYATLIILTVANSLEVSALGVLTNTDILSQMTSGAPVSFSSSQKLALPWRVSG